MCLSDLNEHRFNHNFQNCINPLAAPGFPIGVENIGVGVESIHGGEHGALKMLLKNTCEGVHLLVKLMAKPASLKMY